MKTVDLLLMDNVENLGIIGDVVKVKPGYARNYLLPRGLATQPTPGSIARLAEAKAEMEAKLKVIREKQQALLEKIEDLEITIQRSANEQGVLFAAVSALEIAEALQSQGYPVEERAVRPHESIKRLDSYEVTIVLAADLKTTIKLWIVSDKPAEELNTDGEQPSAEDEDVELEGELLPEGESTPA